MSERIRDKIKQFEEFKDYLYDIFPLEFEEYEKDLTIKAACERYIEKIIEGCVDISFLIAKEKSLELPEEEDSIFQILAKNKIISNELSERLRSAKGMRNVLAHQYGEIDDIKVFYSIQEELKKDIEEFLRNVGEKIKIWKLAKHKLIKSL